MVKIQSPAAPSSNSPSGPIVPLASSTVATIKRKIKSLLSSQGYNPVPYSNHLDVVAYSQNVVPTWEEPIVLDYRGLKNPILKIAVRDAEGSNEGLDNQVRELLEQQGIEDPIEICLFHEDGTRVYEVRR